MRRIGILVAISLSLSVVSSAPVVAGVYSDELAKCLVRETTDADRTFLVKWIFASASVHPAVKSISSVSDADRTALNKTVAKLVERLLTESCKNETQNSLKYEGPTALQPSFEVLGAVAGRGLLSDPAVFKSMTEFASYLDKQKFEAIFGPAR